MALDSSTEVREIQSLRERLAIQHDLNLVHNLSMLEAIVWARERCDAIAWCHHSRVRWLSIGDAPSYYFFAQMRVKWENETIRCIKREDGSLVEDEGEIIWEVGTYYVEIFTKDPLIQENVDER